MRRIHVVVNPESRRLKRRPMTTSRLREMLGAQGRVHQASTRSSLRSALGEVLSDESPVLAVCGGDGTGHVVLSELCKLASPGELPTIAWLRGGTMNTVANALGVPRHSPERLLARLIESERDLGAPAIPKAERHTLRVGDRIGFLFGTGAIDGFLSEYYATGRPSPPVAALTLGRGALSAAVGGEVAERIGRRVTAEARFSDGTSWPRDRYFAIGAGTVDQIGLGFRPFFRARQGVPKMHVIGIRTDAPGFVMELHRIWRGQPMRATEGRDRLAESVELDFDAEDSAFMIDGDLHRESSPFRLELGPEISMLL